MQAGIKTGVLQVGYTRSQLQRCINPSDCPCYLTRCFCFLNVVSWPCTLILEWTISMQVGSFTFPTFEWTFIQMWLFRLSTYRSNWITHSLGWLLLLIPESRRFETFIPLIKLLILLVLPCLMVIRFTFALLIAILILSYCFFESSRFIKLNSIFLRLR